MRDPAFASDREVRRRIKRIVPSIFPDGPAYRVQTNRAEVMNNTQQNSGVNVHNIYHGLQASQQRQERQHPDLTNGKGLGGGLQSSYCVKCRKKQPMKDAKK